MGGLGHGYGFLGGDKIGTVGWVLGRKRCIALTECSVRLCRGGLKYLRRLLLLYALAYFLLSNLEINQKLCTLSGQICPLFGGLTPPLKKLETPSGLEDKS